ncbi:MAG: D-alanyl-D-alanine carboxypeptidase/D-alanyl-D-alanine-endopeptidase [Bryobacterales bacterium]|nr:D-alanyl-D-alanine carboxypeptidase/D-alanyl-D-alanine-endopeptidase [Bryobacterales bacterium]MBV9400520.1 D-alanyl-D-alanine carboxypeptidase/D-alanyl-D-alanine-endopeptidase [Bryobacterales bacterium]
MAADLPHRLDYLIDSNPLAQHANVGIHVVDLKSGKSLYGRNENRLFLPASNLKLFTSALALQKLGPDYRFTTRLIRESAGDIVLAGSGDPSLNGRAYPYQRDASLGPGLASIEDLADQAVTAGLREVKGDVIGDDRLYPWSPYPPSWTQDDAIHESGAPVSALSVADNIVNIAISPGSAAGDPAKLTLEPRLEYFAIDNRITTAAGAGFAEIQVSRLPGARQILLSGTMRLKAGSVREQVGVDDPALYSAYALQEALTRRGVLVRGHPAARHRSPETKYVAPEGETLAVRISPPLSQILQLLDKVSENLHAELMLGAAGGLDGLNSFLSSIGGGPRDSRIDDGSGLSRNDQVTPKLMTRLLAHMYKTNNRDAWIAMLPVGGDDGTLSKRLCCSAGARRIHAKTGTLARSIALSGYAESKTHGWLAFSIFVNNFAAPASEIQAWIDKIALTLTE